MVRITTGETYFSVSRTVQRSGAGGTSADRLLALGLGFEIRRALCVVYADSLYTYNDEAGMPIGINCRMCERPNCSERALPPQIGA